jgi:hypothetical protein
MKAYQHLFYKMRRFDYFNLTKEVPFSQTNKINLDKEHKYVEKVNEK